MSADGLAAASDKMRADGTSEDALAVFTRFYRQLESGATGIIAEADIHPVPDLPSLDSLEIDDELAAQAVRRTAVIKLNGGLATSMGLHHAKSLLEVKDGSSFLDIIARQVLHAREHWAAGLPVLFMNSFRTHEDTLAALEKYPELVFDGLPLDFVQNREPKLTADTLDPITWPADPELEWCPPGHADLYPVLRSTGILEALIDRGYTYAFCSNADNLGAVLDARLAGYLALTGAPFVMEATRRTPADQKGGHLAVRRSDGRLVLRETAQTSAEDSALMQDLSRHRYCNTNNVWLDLVALRDALATGPLDLPLIRNEKTVDPSDKSTPTVIQIESAMGAAIQAFDGATAVDVSRDRFIPVKKTNDLLVLRSDRYELGGDASVHATVHTPIVVDLDPRYYAVLADFDKRFPNGAPSLRQCTSLVVEDDVTFGGDEVLVGDVRLP